MNTPVEILLSYPTGNSKRADLTVRDRASGMLLVHVQLTPTEHVDFMSISQVTPTALAEVSDRLDRVGKTSRRTVVDIGYVTGHYGSDVPAEVTAVADRLLSEG